MTDPLTLPAGVELDREMADLFEPGWLELSLMARDFTGQPFDSDPDPQPYSESTGTATELLERVCRERGWGWTVAVDREDGPEQYCAAINGQLPAFLRTRFADTLALAICRALLSAAKAEKEKA